MEKTFLSDEGLFSLECHCFYYSISFVFNDFDSEKWVRYKSKICQMQKVYSPKNGNLNATLAPFFLLCIADYQTKGHELTMIPNEHQRCDILFYSEKKREKKLLFPKK